MSGDSQTLVMVMENHAGALSNLAGLFAQRAINIESLTVIPNEQDQTLSTVRLTSNTDLAIMRSLAKQIDRLVDVIQVNLLTHQTQASNQELSAGVSEC